ncbi:MAG: hypothetical protein Q9222_007350 [Ikaeria aurantiellina]
MSLSGLPSCLRTLAKISLLVPVQISKQLKEGYKVNQLDDVRVIRDRQTKVSRGFGFIRFPSMEISREFMEHNYPSIYLYGKETADNNNQAAKVRIAYSRERDDRPRGDKEGEWTCKISPQIDMASFGVAQNAKQHPMLNSGDSDAAPNGVPSQFLLLRGLEPTVTEDLLAKGVTKLYKPNRASSPPAASKSKKANAKVASTTGDANLGAKEGSLRRVLLVRDRKSNESWRYGFAEFATVDVSLTAAGIVGIHLRKQDAQAATLRFNSFDKFTISSKPVTVNYVHAGVFVPVFNAAQDPDEFTISPLGNTATKLSYWDKEAYVSQLIVSSGSPKQGPTSLESQAKSAADLAAAAAEGEGLVQPGKENEIKVKKRKAEAATAAAKLKKTAPPHLQFWSNRHAELHGIRSESAQDAIPDDMKAKQPPSAAEDSAPTQTFADPVKKCCYLCSRQFKVDDQLNRHERSSQLHRDNLKNEALVAQAKAKMTKAGLSSSTTNTSSQDEPAEYRDRAKERRAFYGTSKKISLPLKKKQGGYQPKMTAKFDNDDEPEQPVLPSKGASLLGKMGWSAGEGLGAQGTGRTESIPTEMYVRGVGLGAKGGKIGDAVQVAGRNTTGGYSDFLERTKDKAKERYEKMG